MIRCIDEPHADHVSAFMSDHARMPRDETCYLPVEHLRVTAEHVLLGIRLLPADGDTLPEEVRASLSPSSPIGAIAAVPAHGTSFDRMEQRSRLVAEHALRVLRIALREHRGIHGRQLRFRLDIRFTFGRGRAGWRTADDAAYELGLDDRLIKLAEQQPVWAMPLVPRTDVDRHADLAMRWMERAIFAGDQIVALLFLCFALEALLGDTSEGLKGPALAFRQAMLSHLIEGGFAHPSQTLLLYEEIRSAAVHGENPPSLGSDELARFAWGVRRTLAQYVAFARTRGFTRRSRVRRSLDWDPDRPKMIAWLRERGGADWGRYLSNLEEEQPPTG